MSIATEISRIKDAKDAIRASIIAKGVNVPQAAKLDTYADRIDEIVQTASGNMEVVTSSPSGTINAADNKFYMLSGDAGALVFNLPAMQQGGHGIYLLMTTASTSVVSFTSTGSVPINFPTGFQVEADKCYLMDFEFAQSEWQVSVEEWFVNGGGSDQWESIYASVLNRSITEINATNIPSSVTTIGKAAFESCNSLGSVTTPATLTTIDSYVFLNCNNLRTINFPNVTSLGEAAIKGCTKLASASIPNVTSMGANVFEGCNSLTSISIPNVTSLGNYAFYNCYKLASASIPNVTSIGYQSFSNCKSLASAPMPNVTSIGNSAFYNCYLFKPEFAQTTPPTAGSTIFGSLYKPILVPETAIDTYKTATGWSTYAHCFRSLGWKIADEGLTVEDGYSAQCWRQGSIDNVELVTSDGVKVFDTTKISNKTGLTFIIVAEGVEKISGQGLGYSSVVTLYLPSTLTAISYRTIRNASELCEIICMATTPPNAINGIEYLNSLTSIYVPDESVDAYKTATAWKNFAWCIKPVSEYPYV